MEPPSLPWLHGFATPVWHHLVQHLLMKQKHHPYGSNSKIPKCYGATDASMAPWFHHPGQASLGTAIAYEAKQHPYGSTINCTQSYAATEPSMAPLVRNPGRVSFGTQIIHNDKHYPCASTIKCTQCHPTIKPFVVPCALYAQRVVRIVLNFTQTKSLYYSLFGVTRWGNLHDTFAECLSPLIKIRAS